MRQTYQHVSPQDTRGRDSEVIITMWEVEGFLQISAENLRWVFSTTDRVRAGPWGLVDYLVVLACHRLD